MNRIIYFFASAALITPALSQILSAGLLDEALVLEPGGVVRVDMQTGRSPRIFNQVRRSGRIAVNSNGIFILGGGGSITQHDLNTGELLGGFGPSIFLQSPKDFAIDVNGDFVVSDDTGFYRIDREESGSTKLFNDDRIGREVEIATDGTIIVSDASGPVPLGLLVLRPGAATPQRITNGEFFSLAIHPSGDLIAVHNVGGTEAIVRVDLETGEISPTLAPFTVRNMQADAIGRIVGFRDNSIVRINLETGGVEQVPLASSRVFDLTLFPVVPGLQPGDANQDIRFDQVDIAQVLTAGKYLTRTAATWGEGDWNGGPGGRPFEPPTGNGQFDQLDIVTALSAGFYLSGPYAALVDGGVPADGQTSIVYDPQSGETSVDAPAGIELTSINIDSAAGIFTGEAAQSLGGSFDNDAVANIFKATFGGSFGSLSFGNVAQVGLSEEFVLGDLSVVGSLAGGGDLGNVDLVYVPEPTSAVLLAIGLVIGLTRIRRAKH